MKYFKLNILSKFKNIINIIKKNKVLTIIVVGLIFFVLLLLISILNDFKLLVNRNDSGLEGISPRFNLVLNDLNPNTGFGKFHITFKSKDPETVKSKKLELNIHSGPVEYTKTEYKKTDTPSFSIVTDEGRELEFFEGSSEQIFYSVFDEGRNIQVVLDSPSVVHDVEDYIIYEKDIEFKISAERLGHYFPFDQYKLEFYIRDARTDTKKNIDNIHLNFWSNDSRFLNTRPLYMIPNGHLLDRSITVDFYRPRYQIVLFLLFILVTFLVVIWSLLRTIRGNNTMQDTLAFISLNITLIIGLPTFRQLILPNNLNYAPFFDTATAIVWILGIVVVFLGIYKSSNKNSS